MGNRHRRGGRRWRKELPAPPPYAEMVERSLFSPARRGPSVTPVLASLEGEPARLRLRGTIITQTGNVAIAKVTIRTARPVPEDSVIAVFEQALEMQGATLVRQGDVYSIMPEAKAASKVGAPKVLGRFDQDTGGTGINVIPLHNVSAAQMAKVLEPFVPKSCELKADPARNVLLFAGSGPEAQTILEVAQLFDVDWLAGMPFGLLSLRYTSAKDVAAELHEIFGAEFGAVGDACALPPSSG